MTTVQVEQGRATGNTAGGVFQFLGLPYAAPPVGPRRWRAPTPARSWDGVRDATVFAPAAVQTFDAGIDLRAAQSEDCLYLNVWTSTLDSGARHPVMVWIHGGGFLNGAGSLGAYDGSMLARRGVTVITLNYRLGAFGFATEPNMGTNFAVLDWVAALSWVAQNISAFGGDSASVTIFGQSAGAAAVRALLSTPTARGLFHRAIIQSAGFEEYASVPSPSYARAAESTARLFDRLGGGDIDALRQVSAEQVREASLEMSGIFPPPGQVHTPANLVWYPVSDGSIVDARTFLGWAADVPVMLGCVENESRFFIRPSGLYAHPEADPAGTYTAATLTHMARALGGDRADDIVCHLTEPGRSAYEALDELYSTAIWFEPALATLDRFAALGRTAFYYRFARISPGARRTGELVRHGAEVPYVFGHLEPTDMYDDTDATVSDLVQGAWVAFARAGIPAGPDRRQWPRYDPADPRVTVIGDVTTEQPLTASPITELIRLSRWTPLPAV